MRGGEFPDYGFVLLDQGEPLLKVLDGARRSIAFLEYGQTQIPVRVIQMDSLSVGNSDGPTALDGKDQRGVRSLASR
jgi:hypothetical protein